MVTVLLEVLLTSVFDVKVFVFVFSFVLVLVLVLVVVLSVGGIVGRGGGNPGGNPGIPGNSWALAVCRGNAIIRPLATNAVANTVAAI
jgi:hypothetical protein